MRIKVAVDLIVKYLAPIVTKIIKSKISVIGKSLYEKLYNRIVDTMKSFETALEKCLNTNDIKKLKKRIVCCDLGLKFFTKIHLLLAEADYMAAIEEAKIKYNKLANENLDGVNDD